MTRPRQITQGATGYLTIRAVNRSFRFVPSKKLNSVVSYVLAYVAKKFGVAIHEFVVMSNHLHVLLTDSEARLPDFAMLLNSMLSRSLNALRGSTGTNIEKNYGFVVDHDGPKVFEHAVYTLLNPVAAGLVARANAWKGLTSLRMEYGKRIRVRKPNFGLWARKPKDRGAADKRSATRRNRSVLPDSLEFVLVRPPAMPELDDKALRRKIRDEVGAGERRYAEKRRVAGKKVMGMAAVQRQSWTQLPKPEQLFRRQPHVAAKNPGTRVNAIRRRSRFIAAYYDVLQRWLDGEKAVDFPSGTWLMARRYGVNVAPAPS